jgi:o-succinylbenzoate synthase
VIERIEVLDGVVCQRPTLELRLTDRDGCIGHGEAAPVPGYSPDDAGRCREALHGLSVDALAGVLPMQASELISDALPAAQFAVETALFDLLARRAKRPVWELLCAVAENHEHAEPVPLGKLLTEPDAGTLIDAARAAVAGGFRTLKLKVGRGNFATELDLLRRLRDAVGHDVALRLDANRAWTPVAARARLAALAELGPELVEEPTADLMALAESPVSLALDESLQPFDAVDRLGPAFERCRVRAFVLKPTTLGGFSRCLGLARRAAGLGLDVVVSHAFEGRVGFAACCALAVAIASRSRASGLAPHAGLGGAELPGLSDGELRGSSDEPGLGFLP